MSAALLKIVCDVTLAFLVRFLSHEVPPQPACRVEDRKCRYAEIADQDRDVWSQQARPAVTQQLCSCICGAAGDDAA